MIAAINFPNFLSMFRVFLVPLFFLNLYYYYHEGIEVMLWWSRGTLVVIVLSDFLDGYLARRWSETSTVGSLLDPLADKLFVTASYVLLAVFNRIPPWLTIIVVSKDLLVLIGWSGMAIMLDRVEVHPSQWSKWATAFQFMTVCAIIFLPPEFPFAWFYFTTGMLTLVALFHYGYGMLLEISEKGM